MKKKKPKKQWVRLKECPDCQPCGTCGGDGYIEVVCKRRKRKQK